MDNKRWSADVNVNLLSNTFGQQTISGSLFFGDNQSDSEKLEKNKHK